MNRKIITFNKHLMAPRNLRVSNSQEVKLHKQMKRSSSHNKNQSVKSNPKVKCIKQKPQKQYLSPPPKETKDRISSKDTKDRIASKNKKVTGSRNEEELREHCRR